MELEHGINPGVWLHKMANDLVPIYEEHRVRIERGIDLDTWSAMNVDEKAMVIAVNRTNNALANLQAEAEIEQAKRK